nr:immunoglobulin heavy chain junction region [Mus musculus]
CTRNYGSGRFAYW